MAKLKKETSQKTKGFEKFLDTVEKLGNKLPSPIIFFTVLCFVVVILSFIASKAKISAINPGTKETINAVNLLCPEGLVKILTNMVDNFSNFPPLGLVVVSMIGIGFADNVGLLPTLLESAVAKAPSNFVIPTIAFIGIVSNAAGDCGPIILPPLCAVIFLSLKRHPLAGMALAYACSEGAFAATCLVSMTDALVTGFTLKAAQLIDSSYIINPACNYYFLAVSVILFVPIVTLVNEKIVEPRLGAYKGGYEDPRPLSDIEVRGLRAAGWSVLVYIIVLLLLTLPQNAILRNPETGSLAVSPFMDSIIPITMLLFLIPGLAYGYTSGTIKSSKDISDMMSKSMSELGSFLVLAFVAGQFLALFDWSNLGPIIAIKGAEFLQGIGLTGIGLLIGFILLIAIINIFVPSMSAKYGMVASIFVPMFMILGYNPAFTQVAYRIGDSITNPITPLMPYFAIMLGYAQQYDKDIGMGTMMSLLVPYSVVLAVMWILLLVIWFILKLPVGPGAPIFL